MLTTTAEKTRTRARASRAIWSALPEIQPPPKARIIRGLPLGEGVLGLRILAMEGWLSRIGTVSADSRMSGAGGRVALRFEMAESIIDLIALTSLQSAGGLGFAAANCGGLVSSFARMD